MPLECPLFGDPPAKGTATNQILQLETLDTNEKTHILEIHMVCGGVWDSEENFDVIMPHIPPFKILLTL